MTETQSSQEQAPKAKASAMREFPKIGGYHFRSPYTEDYSISGSILGSPC